MYQAISRASKTSSRQVKLSPTLRNELSHWRSLGEISLAYRFNCFRIPLILDGADAFLALVVPKL